jgi:hypothetical protein
MRHEIIALNSRAHGENGDGVEACAGKVPAELGHHPASLFARMVPGTKALGRYPC